ncbi:protein SHI RELATED SEQUENCE 3-like isoform X2 [Vigna radiata var. radiata]|uniref:Protein SHI RELATED SEQUENCE 3-like isoform X2 n=1 Tax=Vigna radiata var. radiata TaxID=3916 RepID=A0A3Q0EXZ9_VIGRR|nr:protein SHI RELATED SEQUENCE 3-like isoform X2 [Vigna radiata var. radiata]
MQRRTEGEEEVVSRGSKCQDCGNQAKKECSYSRCRTCCKNKGFQCQTHIKSTWTPVDRRRTKDNFHPHNLPQNHNQINPYSGLEMKFPCATSSMAMFRCVQVRSVDDAVNEIAYQTSVNIGGHVFSGILYDQGPEQSYNINKGESSTALVDEHQNASIHSRDSSGVTIASAGHADPLFPPPPYPFPLASFRPGMPYFTYPRS